MANTKPLLGAALVCDRLLQEQDDVLSAIRIVDRFTATETTKAGPDTHVVSQPAFDVSILVILNAGDLLGEFGLTLTVRRPSGSTTPLGQWTVSFSETVKRTNVIGRIRLGAKEWGLHWIDVDWEGERLTSIPLTLALTTDPPDAPTPD